MKFRTLLLASVFGGLLLGSANAAFINPGPNVLVLYEQVTEINELGQSYVVTKTTSTITETDPDTNNITVRRGTTVSVPDGNGGFTKTETRETTVAGLNADNTYAVETTTVKVVTELDAYGDPTSLPVRVDSVLTDTVAEDVLVLPTTTVFVPVSEELDEPLVISPL
jgi:hypothetical protein